jgi:hypothetical protein
VPAKVSQAVKKRREVNISTKQYLKETGSEQFLHFPDNTNQLKTGTFRWNGILYLQLGQNERRGWLIERPRGTR